MRFLMLLITFALVCAMPPRRKSKKPKVPKHKQSVTSKAKRTSFRKVGAWSMDMITEDLWVVKLGLIRTKLLYMNEMSDLNRRILVQTTFRMVRDDANPDRIRQMPPVFKRLADAQQLPGGPSTTFSFVGAGESETVTVALRMLKVKCKYIAEWCKIRRKGFQGRGTHYRTPPLPVVTGLDKVGEISKVGDGDCHVSLPYLNGEPPVSPLQTAPTSSVIGPELHYPNSNTSCYTNIRHITLGLFDLICGSKLPLSMTLLFFKGLNTKHALKPAFHEPKHKGAALGLFNLVTKAFSEYLQAPAGTVGKVVVVADHDGPRLAAATR